MNEQANTPANIVSKTRRHLDFARLIEEAEALLLGTPHTDAPPLAEVSKTPVRTASCDLCATCRCANSDTTCRNAKTSHADAADAASAR